MNNSVRSANTAVNLDNPADLLDVHVKLRGSLDGQMVIWWVRATTYAVIETRLTPLFKLLNGSFQTFSRGDDGNYRITMLELGYFTDLTDGSLLREWTNPFSNKTGIAPPALFGPHQAGLTSGGLQPPEHFPFGELKFTGSLGPVFSDGEDVWVQENTLVEMTSENPAFGDYHYHELVTYQGAWKDVNKAKIPSVMARMTYNTTSNWRPWMMADGVPGHIATVGMGKKVNRIAELPGDFLALAELEHPDVLADPEKYLRTSPC